VGRSLVAVSIGRRLVLALDRLINTERCRNYSIIFIVLGYGLILASTFLGHLPRTAFGESVLPDFLVHWTGGRLVLNGQLNNLYDQGTQLHVQTAAVGQTSKLAWFIAPPFVGLLYAPLAGLPYLASAGVWTLLSAMMLLIALKLARPLAPNISRARWRMIILVCFASQPVLELLGSGQDSAFSLLIWVAGTRLILVRRDVLAGVVFALGLGKPQLFVLVPVVLLVQRRFQSLVAWLSTASVLALISVSMVGVDGVQNWLMLPFGDAYRQAVRGLAWKMQGLPSFATSVIPPGLARGADVVGLLAILVILVLFITACRPDDRPGFAASVCLRLGGAPAGSAVPAGTSRHTAGACDPLRALPPYLDGACWSPPGRCRALADIGGWRWLGCSADFRSVAHLQT
jgi:Glycosyltransferase family 87